MSFHTKNLAEKAYAPGWFLAAEACDRLTYQMEQAKAETAENGGKYIPMGTVWPANDGTAVGIVFEDVDVTAGDMPGSVVVMGTVYKNRLPKTLNSAAQTALEGKGFVFLTEAGVTRPY